MSGGKKIGLLGGSFNPAHAGHLHISQQALKRLGLDEVWWLVSPQNPLKPTKGMEKYETRFAKAQEMAADARIRVLDIEAREGLYYTIDTLTHLQKIQPRTKFVWLMGADNLSGFHRWRAWREIAQRIPIAVLDRAPYGMRALHQRFAMVFSRFRLGEQKARKLADSLAPAWIYLTIPRSPLSATELRKTLGTDAFVRNNKGKK